MTFIETIEKSKADMIFPDQERDDILGLLEDEIRCALSRYLEIVEKIFSGSGIRLGEVPPSFFSLKHNFFSAIFVFSYYKAGISKDRRLLYAAINQCLRGMVTGCDNLLDDEYKQTIPTDLPATATRFRSVLDIMISDRVLFELLLDTAKTEQLSLNQISQINTVSLQALLQSGAQEAGEEKGINHILAPDQVLAEVHHYKTGVLFQAPWAIPQILEKISSDRMELMKKALYNIGMGCQIMDDIVDLQNDIRNNRHNYVLSTLYHACDPQTLQDFFLIDQQEKTSNNILAVCPEVRSMVLQTALKYLRIGLETLFTDQYRKYVDPSIVFMAERIGVPLSWIA